jgi:hypothetical protein
MPDEVDEEFGGEGPVIEVDTDTLATVEGLSRIIDGIKWYQNVGVPLDEATKETTEAYLAAMGFSDLHVVPVLEADEITQVLEERDWGGAWADGEEQSRSALADEALHQLDAEVIQAAAHHLGSHAHGAATTAANSIAALQLPTLISADPDGAGPADQAAEDARDAACQAGRWPLGVIGGSFYVF